MWIGQRLELVLVMLDRLMVARLADLDCQEIVRDLALMHDDVGIDRFAEMVVGRDDGSVRKPHGAFAKPVVVAIDLPARKLLFDMHGEPVCQRAFAEITLQDEGFVRVEFAQGGDQSVELALHSPLRSNPSERKIQVAARAAYAGTSFCQNCTSI